MLEYKLSSILPVFLHPLYIYIHIVRAVLLKPDMFSTSPANMCYSDVAASNSLT